MNRKGALISQWVTARKGKELIGIKALVFDYQNELFLDSPESVSLIFEGDEMSGQFTTASDGSSIVWKDKPLKPIDMDEHGKIREVDVTDEHPYNLIIHSRLDKGFLIYSKFEDTVIGTCFVFSNGVRIQLVNLGDDLKVFQGQVKALETDEDIEHLEI